MQRRRTFPQPYHVEMEEAWAEGEPWADAFQWALQLKLIQRHGCPTQLRARVWPHLLGFDMNSWEEAESLYAKLRQLAASAEAAQAFCLSQGAPEDYYPGVQRMLDVDVPRAPRNCPFLQGDARPQGLARLRAVLEALCLIEPELGYWQGYADIAAPFLAVFGQDHQAFWALRQLLAVRLRHAFATPLPPPSPTPPPSAQVLAAATGGPLPPLAPSPPSFSAPKPPATSALDVLWSEIEKVSSILSNADPKLHSHLSHLSIPFGQSPTQCSFQMIHIYFSRELPLDQLQVFWEAMWASEEELRLSTNLSNGHTSVAPNLHTSYINLPPPSSTDSARRRSSYNSSRCELEPVPEGRGSGHGALQGDGEPGGAPFIAGSPGACVQEDAVEPISQAAPPPISSPASGRHQPRASQDLHAGGSSSSNSSGSSVQRHARSSGNAPGGIDGSTCLAQRVEPAPLLFSPPTSSDSQFPQDHQHGQGVDNSGTWGAECLEQGSMHAGLQGPVCGPGEVCDSNSSRVMGSGRKSLSASVVPLSQERVTVPDAKLGRGRGGSSGHHGVGGEEGWGSSGWSESGRTREEGEERKEAEEEGERLLGRVGGGSKRLSENCEGLGAQENGSCLGTSAVPRRAMSLGDHKSRWGKEGLDHSSHGAEMGPIFEGSEVGGEGKKGVEMGHGEDFGVGRKGSSEQAGYTEGGDTCKGPVEGEVNVSGVGSGKLKANGVGRGVVMEMGGGVRSGKAGKRGMLSRLEEDVLEEPEGEGSDWRLMGSQKHGSSGGGREAVLDEVGGGKEVMWGENCEEMMNDSGVVVGPRGLGSTGSQGLRLSGKAGEVVLEEPDEDEDSCHGNGGAHTALSARRQGSQSNENVGSAPEGGWTSQGAGPLFGGSSGSSGGSAGGVAVAEGLPPLQHSSERSVQGAGASAGFCSSRARGVAVAEGLLPLQHSRERGVQGAGAVAGFCNSSARGVAVAEGLLPQQHSSERGVQGAGAVAGFCNSSARGVAVAEGLLPRQHSSERGVQGAGASAGVCSRHRHIPVTGSWIFLSCHGEGKGSNAAHVKAYSSSSWGVPVAEGAISTVSTLPEPGRGPISSAPAARAHSPPWNASLSLRPYGAAALLCAHRQTLLSCTQLEHVVQFCNALPPLPTSPVALASHARELWHMQNLETNGTNKAAVQGAARDHPSVLITKSTDAAGSKAAASAQEQQGKQAHAATPSQKKRLPLHKRVLKAITPGKVKKPPQNGIAIVATNDGNKDGGPVEQGREREGGERVKGRVGSFQGSNTKGSKHGADPSHNSKHTSFFRCDCVTPSLLSFSQHSTPRS